MKNLKKVLALVLALATVMGLGITASAKTYTDSSKIEYTEAVDVMSAIDVLGGMPDGSFNPQGNLTREQAAKMVSYLLNGGKDVNDLYKGSNTFVDCYNDWSKGYIAYVNQMGIVSGVGNGKFNPKGTLTGVQLAKMMLGALGYDAKIEGYQDNNNWQVNIINDAQNAGLLKGMDTVNLYTAITREQASQMMFNALKADMVGYESKGSEITLPGIGTIIQGASTPKAEKQGSYANNLGKDDEKEPTLQMAEKYFGGTKGLKPTKKGEDDFGRPAHEWMYDAKVVGTYANEADLTYTTKVKAEDIYKDLGKITDTADVYTDGSNNKTTQKIDKGETQKIGGQGTKTEVFVNNVSDKDEITIVVTNTYTSTISKFYKATDDTKASISLKDASGKFETNAFTKDDEGVRVLYTKANGTIKSVVKAESVDGVMTKYASDAISINGTSYKVAANAGTSLDTGDYEGTYTYYLDTYGNLIYAELKQAGGSKDYAYVEKVDESDSLFGGSGVKAQIVLADGTKAVVDIDTYSTKSGTMYKLPGTNGATTEEKADGKLSNKTVGNWFSYTVNSAKEYTFNKVNANYATVVDMDGKGDGKELVKDKATTFTVDGSRTAYTNADTTVTSVDKDYKVSTATGLVGADLEGKVLVTYNKGSKTINAIYAVVQDITLSNADVTYAYALKKDGTTKDGDLWKFAINGKVESYTVDKGTNVIVGGIYNLGLADGKVTTGIDKEVSNAKTGGKVDFADNNTVVITDGDGAGTYTTGEKFAIYNVDKDLADSDVGMTDVLEEGDSVKFVTDGKDTILVAFIVAEAE